MQVDGGLRTGRDVVIGALLGADEFGFATAPLIAAGCIMMRKCHLNTCPVGVATQDPVLRKRFIGQPEHVINFFFFVAEEVREIHGGKLGFRSFNEMIGQMQMLDRDKAIGHWKANGLDFAKLFHKPQPLDGQTIYRSEAQDHNLDKALDQQLIARSAAALERGAPVRLDTADAQRQPHRRRHAVGRGVAPLRLCRPAGQHHPHPRQGHGRPELRRLAGAWRDA